MLDISEYGNFAANFRDTPPTIPPEYWIPVYGVIVSSIVGWSIPSIIGWMKSKEMGKTLHQYHKRISLLYNDGRLDEYDIEQLDKLKIDIVDAYSKGKISDQQYGNLNTEISLLYKEIYSKKIDSLDNLSHKDNNVQLLNIKTDIVDAYSKGKINEFFRARYVVVLSASLVFLALIFLLLLILTALVPLALKV